MRHTKVKGYQTRKVFIMPNPETAIINKPAATIIKNLEEINSWSHTWAEWIKYLAQKLYFKTKPDTCLEELQVAFPNAESQPYNKNYFIKLHKLVLEYNACNDALKRQQEAHEKLDSIQQDYKHSPLFSMLIPLIKLLRAKVLCWHRDSVTKTSEEKFYIAKKDCILEKLKQNPSLKKKVKGNAKNELLALESFSERKALARLKATLVNKEKEIPADFWTNEILKSYIVFGVGGIAETLKDTMTAIGNENPATNNKKHDHIKHCTTKYKEDPKNQLRLAIRVAANVRKILQEEIKQCDKDILHLEAKKAELSTADLKKFKEAPKAFIKAWSFRAGYFIRLGFKNSNRTEDTTASCDDKITELTDTKGKHAANLKAISDTRPMFWGFSSDDKQPQFMRAVNAGKQYVNSLPTSLKEKFGLTTELEKDTYSSHFYSSSSLSSTGGAKDYLIRKEGDNTIKKITYTAPSTTSREIIPAETTNDQKSLAEAKKLTAENINALDFYGMTALMHAASKGHVETTRYLLDNSAQIYLPHRRHKNALGWAREGKHEETAKLIVEAMKNVQYKYGFNNHEFSTRTISGLLDAGIDINETYDDANNTVLHLLAAYNGDKACKYALEKGADINAKNKDGDTPLHLAISGKYATYTKEKHSFIDTINVLLANKDIDIHASNNQGETALDLAIAKDCKDAIKLLQAETPKQHNRGIEVASSELKPAAPQPTKSTSNEPPSPTKANMIMP